MERRSSLGKIIIKYSILELFYSLFLLVCFFILIDALIIMGIFYRADYASSHLPEVKESIAQKTWKIEKLPYYYDYQIIQNGHTEQTIPSKYNVYIEQAKKEGKSQTNNLIGVRYFVYDKNPYREIVLSYRVTLIFTNKTLYRFFPNAETLCSFTFLIVWIMGIIGFIRQCIKKIQTELAKVTRTNKEISKMNLDYQRESSLYKEIQELLDSLDVMSLELKYSLQEQWKAQQKQKELVQSMTHDIRTPITLVKGHLELLKEDLGEKKHPSLHALDKGVHRLEEYIEQLKRISASSATKKSLLDTSLIKEWIELAEELARSKNHSVLVKHQDTSTIFIDKEQLTRAFQNVLVNSIEHSDVGTTLYLSFKDNSEFFYIIVEDEGIGFSPEALSRATERFYTTKVSQEYRGLGLAIAKEILLEHQGNIFIKNTETGASVTLELKKEKNLGTNT
jgi:signal transduction histidine kinase